MRMPLNEVYMLACADGSLYTGWTNDLSARLQAHQEGRGAKYTRSRLPVRLAYQQACLSPTAARKREAELKRHTRAAKLELIARYDGLLALARQQLQAWHRPDEGLLLLREKEGIALFRVLQPEGPAVLKLFTGETGRAEPAFYKLLAAEGLQTLPPFQMDAKALLLPDLHAPGRYALAGEQHMASPGHMEALGRWYRALHQIPVERHPWLPLSKEWAALSPEGLARAWPALAAQGAGPELLSRLERLIHKAAGLPLRLCYNDFYYVNLVVGREEPGAFMMDYGRMGLNHPALDLVNALWFSPPDARAAFLSSYGLDWGEEAWAQLLPPLQDWLLGESKAAETLLSEAYGEQLSHFLKV